MPLIEVIEVADPPEAWRAAGFAVDDDGTCRVGTVRLRLVGGGGGPRAWSLAGLDGAAGGGADGGAAIDGVPTEESDLGPADPGAHPNGVRSIDHVVMSSPHLDRTVDALAAAGFQARRTRHLTSRTTGEPARQVFYRLGEVILELAGPDAPKGDGPARLSGLAFTVEDLDRTLEVLGERVGAAKEAVQPGRRIATLRGRDLGLSTPIAFMTPDPRHTAAR